MAQIETNPPIDILAIAIARWAAAADRRAAQSDLDRVYALIEELSVVKRTAAPRGENGGPVHATGEQNV
jgi:hypothetical protein